MKILILIGILAILGINILKYLARGAVKVTNTAKNIGEDVADKVKINGEKSEKLQQAIDNNKKNERILPSKPEDVIQRKEKGGWCYVGTDRGFRSCIEINDSGKCMSGDIFPTRKVCINPSLRV